MYVCICNKVTDTQIRRAARNGVCSVDALCKNLKVGSCCGKCKECAKEVLHEALDSQWRLEISAHPVLQTA